MASGNFEIGVYRADRATREKVARFRWLVPRRNTGLPGARFSKLNKKRLRRVRSVRLFSRKLSRPGLRVRADEHNSRRVDICCSLDIELALCPLNHGRERTRAPVALVEMAPASCGAAVASFIRRPRTACITLITSALLSFWVPRAFADNCSIHQMSAQVSFSDWIRLNWPDVASIKSPVK